MCALQHPPNPGESPPRLGLTEQDWLTVIAAAATAPSIHNTQPWRFVVHGDRVEMHLDQDRLLPVADPVGREARISCGAALLNLRLALRANGLDPQVAMLPRRAHPTLLAIVRPEGSQPASPAELSLHGAIRRRRSHRQPFHEAPVPKAALRNVVYAAGTEGGYLRLVLDPATAGAVVSLVRRAEHIQAEDAAYQDELAKWIFKAGTRGDGVPRAASGPRPDPNGQVVMRDFAPQDHRPAKRFESDPLLGVLLSPGDTALDQLRCGQSLQRALLTATEHGIGASIMSAPVELAMARDSLRRSVGGAMWPQLVLRFGMAVPVAATPRRPVSEFVEFSAADDSVS